MLTNRRTDLISQWLWRCLSTIRLADCNKSSATAEGSSVALLSAAKFQPLSSSFFGSAIIAAPGRASPASMLAVLLAAVFVVTKQLDTIVNTVNFLFN